jgi:hypothetical protein
MPRECDTIPRRSLIGSLEEPCTILSQYHDRSRRKFDLSELFSPALLPLRKSTYSNVRDVEARATQETLNVKNSFCGEGETVL